jgi:hypothetical protein
MKIARQPRAIFYSGFDWGSAIRDIIGAQFAPVHWSISIKHYR